MTKQVYVYALSILLSYTLCKGQNQTIRTKHDTRSQSKGVITSSRFTKLPPTRANFSGEWKLNESKSEFVDFPLCAFGGGDRMRSKIMKIAYQADFITVDVASSPTDGALVVRQEKLTFDGKESDAGYVGIPRKKSAARWSDDGQTMIVTSARSFDTDGKNADFKITEVWRLMNDGKSITVRVNSKSKSGAKIMKLVYDRQMAADYRF
jgi:hypothetical protein